MESIKRWTKQCIMIGIVFTMFVPMADAAGTPKKCKSDIASSKLAFKMRIQKQFARMAKILKDEEKRQLKEVDAAYKSKIKQMVQKYKAKKNSDDLLRNAIEIIDDMALKVVIDRGVLDDIEKIINSNNAVYGDYVKRAKVKEKLKKICYPGE